MKSGEEILADIDTTLDHLIENASVFQDVSPEALCENEVTALQKTQQSLLARLVHMEDLLDDNQKQTLQEKKAAEYNLIEKKIKEFGRLNHALMDDMVKRFGQTRTVLKPRVHRNRPKAEIRA